MYNGRALAYSLALLHSTKFAIALLNEEKLVTLLPCQRRPVSAPTGSLEDVKMTSPLKTLKFRALRHLLELR
jgi:hypothetical protein